MHRLPVALFLILIFLPQSSQAVQISTFLQRPQNEQQAYVAAGTTTMLAFAEGVAPINTGHEVHYGLVQRAEVNYSRR